MPPEADATTQPAEEPKQPATAPTPTTVWQSPENALIPEHGKSYKIGLIVAGVLGFIGLAYFLAYI